MRIEELLSRGDVPADARAALREHLATLADRDAAYDRADAARLQAALADRTAVLDNACKIAHLGHWEYDFESDAFTFNDNFYAIFRTTAEQVGGYVMSSAAYAERFVHPDDRGQVAEEIRRALEASDPGFSRQLDHRCVYSDGTYGYISVRFFVVKDGRGRTVRSFGVNQDITERKRAEEALRQSEEKFAKAFRAAPVLMAIAAVADGELIDVNDEGLRLSGFSREEAIGHRAVELGWIAPEDRRRLYDALQRDCRVAGLEMSFRAKGGSEIAGLVHAERITMNGRECLLLAIMDVTEHRQAERQLRQSEERYRRIIQAVTDYTYTVRVKSGRAGHPRYAAACEAVTGFAGAEYAADPSLWQRMVLADDRALVEEQARRVLAGEEPPPIEHRFVRKDGAVRWVRHTVVPHRDGEGRLISYDGVIADVTERREAEEKLKASEQLFRALIEHSHDAVTMIAADGTILFDSPSITRVLGYSPTERVGRKVFELVPPADREAMRLGFARFTERTQAVALSRVRFVHKDGSVRLIEGVRTNLLDDPVVKAVVVNFRDVTERERANERLRILSGVIEQSVNPIAIVDERGIVEYVNAAMAMQHGRPSADFVGAQWEAFVTAQADLRAQAAQIRHAVLVEGRPWRGDLKDVRGGETAWRDALVFPIKDDEGHTTHVAYMSNDVTARKRAEEALRESEERLSKLIDSASDSIYLLDAELRFVEINKKGLAIARKAKEDIIGRSLAEIVPDVVCSGRLERHREVLRTGEPFVVDDFIPHPVFGDMHFVLKSFRVGTGLGVIAVDVTERKRAEDERRRLEAQVQHAQKLESLGVLAGGIAHDFNNLLVPVLGNASLASRSLPPRSPLRQQIADIEAAARRASDLCNQLLAYAGRGTCLIQALDVSQLVREMANLLRVSISKKAELRLDLAPVPVPVRADGTQLRQILMNLVVNASEALGEQAGTITITAGVLEADEPTLRQAVLDDGLPKGRYAYVEVADTGVGMDAATRGRLFDPFFTTKATGRGLGLSAALGIVRAHRGAILLDSAPGRGTTFRVLLPAATDAELAADRPEPQARAADWSGQGTVLVVDDEPSVIELTGQMLAALGFAVMPAADGREGLALFTAHADELCGVLLDVTMPHLDGEEVLREMRARRPDMPVVLMSGYDRSAVAATNAATFLRKPFDAETFAGALRRAFESKGRAPHGLCILLVDDDAHVRSVGRAILERLGHRVVEAADGRAALEAFAQRRAEIDLVILDQLMPDMDGADVFLALRERSPEVPVFFACANLRADVARTLSAHGVAGFVPKPYGVAELQQALAAVVHGGAK